MDEKHGFWGYESAPSAFSSGLSLYLLHDFRPPSCPELCCSRKDHLDVSISWLLPGMDSGASYSLKESGGIPIPGRGSLSDPASGDALHFFCIHSQEGLRTEGDLERSLHLEGR